MNEDVIQLLKDWEQWEADCLNSNDEVYIDNLPEDLYEDLVSLQDRRNKILLPKKEMPNY